MKKMITLTIAALSIFSVSANDHDLSHWFESELNSHQYVLEQIESESSDVDYLLKTIRVRLRATLSVEIPLVAKGKVRPEIELYYTK